MGTEKNSEDLERLSFREALEQALCPVSHTITADKIVVAEVNKDAEESCDRFASVAYQQFHSLTKAGFYRNEAVGIVTSMMTGFLTNCFE